MRKNTEQTKLMSEIKRDDSEDSIIDQNSDITDIKQLNKQFKNNHNQQPDHIRSEYQTDNLMDSKNITSKFHSKEGPLEKYKKEDVKLGKVI